MWRKVVSEVWIRPGPLNCLLFWGEAEFQYSGSLYPAVSLLLKISICLLNFVFLSFNRFFLLNCQVLNVKDKNTQLTLVISNIITIFFISNKTFIFLVTNSNKKEKTLKGATKLSDFNYETIYQIDWLKIALTGYPEVQLTKHLF